MSDPLRAPEYLVALQNERDEMGRFPGSAVPAGLLLGAGSLLALPGLTGFLLGGGTAALPWVVIGGFIAAPGALLARHSWRWYRRARSIEHGIALFDRRARLRIPPSDNVESPSDDDLAPRVPWEVE